MGKILLNTYLFNYLATQWDNDTLNIRDCYYFMIGRRWCTVATKSYVFRKHATSATETKKIK
jgi:hypothetical protein